MAVERFLTMQHIADVQHEGAAMKSFSADFFEALLWPPRFNLDDVSYVAAVEEVAAHRLSSTVARNSASDSRGVRDSAPGTSPSEQTPD
jgi:hypothetical protein